MTFPDKGTADSEQAEAQIEAQQDDSDAKLTAHVLLEQMGGLSGLIYSSLPVLVFVPISSFFGLTAAIYSALGVAGLVLIGAWRAANPCSRRCPASSASGSAH